jgi:penicillin amidase
LQLLNTGQKMQPEEHWQFMFDTGNTLAQRVAPLMVTAMEGDESLAVLVDQLSGWDYVDDPKSPAPAIFQAIWRRFAWLVYSDELGDELAARMLALNYYWEDRLYTMVRAGDSIWFDKLHTIEREYLDDLVQQAAADALAELSGLMGPDPAQWQWGKIHTITFFSPMIPGDDAADWLGDGTTAKEGSGETLNRAKYKYGEPYRATFIDSLRFLADMNDDDKVMAVLSGGASGRQFDPHLKDQLPAWRTGEPNYWWFSDAAIAEHQQSELMLVP